MIYRYIAKITKNVNSPKNLLLIRGSLVRAQQRELRFSSPKIAKNPIYSNRVGFLFIYRHSPTHSKNLWDHGSSGNSICYLAYKFNVNANLIRESAHVKKKNKQFDWRPEFRQPQRDIYKLLLQLIQKRRFPIVPKSERSISKL